MVGLWFLTAFLQQFLASKLYNCKYRCKLNVLQALFLFFINICCCLQITGAIPGTAPCFSFDIVDQGTSRIALNVSRPKSCDDWSNVDFTNSVSLPMKDIKTEASYIAIRQSLSPAGYKRFTAVDEFTIHTSRAEVVVT